MNPDKQTLDDLRIDRGAPPRSRPPVALFLTVLAGLAVIAVLIWWFLRPQPAAVRTIVVQESVAGGERTLLNAAGYVTARREATVSSKVTGKVMEISVEEGMKEEG